MKIKHRWEIGVHMEIEYFWLQNYVRKHFSTVYY
jgi:hypothetical protein